MCCYCTPIGSNLPPDGGLENTAPNSSLWISSRSFMISCFCTLMTLRSSSRSFSSCAFLLVAMMYFIISVCSTEWPPFFNRPRAASRSCTWVLAIFISFLKSLISFIKVTFSCGRKIPCECKMCITLKMCEWNMLWTVIFLVNFTLKCKAFWSNFIITMDFLGHL